MLPIIEKLLILQARDERVATIQAELTRIPQETAQVQSSWLAAQTAFQTRESEARQAEVERKRYNLEAATARTTIAKYRTQQQQTRKNEEYQALIHEIKHAETKVSELEDKELTLMERVSELDQKLALERAALQGREKDYHRKLEDLTIKRAALEEQVSAALEEQKAAEAGIDEPILLRYRRILVSKKSRAIVPVEHGVCGGCHMKLTTQTAHFVKASKDLVACDNCGRLVYPAD